jgi:hypothetical protein
MDALTGELQRIKKATGDMDDRRTIHKAQDIIALAISHLERMLERDEYIDIECHETLKAAYCANIDDADALDDFIHQMNDMVEQGHDAYTEEGED